MEAFRGRLVVSQGASPGRHFSLEEGENLVGRWDPDQGAFPEIDLDDEDLDAKVSRKHAVVVRRGERVSVADIGSLNGTAVNGRPLAPEEVVDLKVGDIVSFGSVSLRLE